MPRPWLTTNISAVVIQSDPLGRGDWSGSVVQADEKRNGVELEVPMGEGPTTGPPGEPVAFTRNSQTSGQAENAGL